MATSDHSDSDEQNPITFGDGDGEKNIDPTAYRHCQQFQAAIQQVADACPTWIDTMKFEIIWRKANDEPIPKHLQPLLKDDDPAKDTDAAA
jgi:hypothetical protein